MKIKNPEIVPYKGFGDENSFFVHGHVIEQKGLLKPDENASLWANAITMLKRYTGRAGKGLDLNIRYAGKTYYSRTDNDGYYYIELPTEKIKDDHVFYSLEIKGDQSSRISASAWIFHPGKVYHGIISDIDDTVIVSHATQLLRKVRLMLTKNAATRIPFPDVDVFYKLLIRRKKESHFENPLFYVSSSEWNLYDLLRDFMEYHNIPEGIFMLKDMKKIKGLILSGGGSHDHKKEKIEKIIRTVQKLPFILIGDSGQRDTEIYMDIVRTFPGRVKAVYIRKIRKTKEDFEMKKAFRKLGAEYFFMKNTKQAIRHAQKNGYIDKSPL